MFSKRRASKIRKNHQISIIRLVYPTSKTKISGNSLGEANSKLAIRNCSNFVSSYARRYII